MRTMSPSLFLLFIFLELRLVCTTQEFRTEPQVELAEDAETLPVETKDFLSPERKFPNQVERAKVLKRFIRGTKSRTFEDDDDPRKRDDLLSYQTAPRTEQARPDNTTSELRSGLFNPLYPVTDGSYWAYAVTLLAFLLFTAGIVGNLALMCIVWHNIYLKTTWNGIIAGLAFWDFLVVFFCLPVVVFHELSVRRLLGDLSCRLVPYLEVTSLGIATFSVCALSIDRFNAAMAPRALQKPKVEPCQSIISKLSIIWVGSMLLAAPELLLWKLLQETVSLPTVPSYMQQNQLGGTLIATLRTQPEKIKVDICVREPSAELSDGIYSLVLTYHEARMWWFFGCYICLPLLFSLACDLLTRHILAQQLPPKDNGRKVNSRSSSTSSSVSSPKKKQPTRERRLRSTVMALTVLHITCSTPESICSIILTYVSRYVRAELLTLSLPALGLIGQFLLFFRCAATPLLMLFLCHSLGQAFVDCCCCCCEECVPDRDSSSSLSPSTAVTSASPSPTSLSPSSKDELKSILPKDPTLCRGQVSSPSVGFGTPC